MNVLDLYQQLKVKGYASEAADGCAAHCNLSAPSQEFYERQLRNVLELNRREVFLVWYGAPEHKPFGDHWHRRLERASDAYTWGKTDS